MGAVVGVVVGVEVVVEVEVGERSGVVLTLPADNHHSVKLCGALVDVDLKPRRAPNPDPGPLVVYLSCQREEGHEGRHATAHSRDHITWTDG